MEINMWHMPLLVSAIINYIVAVWILKKNPQNKFHRLSSLMMMLLAIWITGVFTVSSSGGNENIGKIGAHILWAGACFIPSISLQFVLTFTRTVDSEKAKYLWLLHLIGIAMYPFMWEGIEPVPNFDNMYDVEKNGFMFAFYGVILIIGVFIALSVLIVTYYKTKNQVERNQFKWMTLGMWLAGVWGTIQEVILPAYVGYHPPPLGGSIASIMGLSIAYSIAKYKLFDIEAVVEEVKPAVEVKQRLESGFNYLIIERGSDHTYEIFRGMVTTTPGLCFTTFFPKKIREEFKMEKTPIIWLTETETEEKTLNPSRLDFEVLYTIESFIKENDKTVVMVDDFHYLSLINGFDKAFAFLKSINDIASINNGTIVVPLNPDLFPEKDRLQIESIFDEKIDIPKKEHEEPVKKPTIKPSYAYLFESAEPDSMYDVMKESEHQTLVITKTYPDKLMKKYQVESSNPVVYWLTTSEDSEGKCLNPARLDFEIMQTIAEFLRKKKGVLVLDCIDMMIMHNDIAKVSEFLKSIIDIASVSQGMIMATMDPNLYKPNEVALLEKRADMVI